MAASREPGQLTQYPIGSIREIWSLSWPLMMGLLSSYLMIVVDRIFLARRSLQDLNAAVNGSLSYYTILVIPLAICAISEVLVGKIHGEGSFEDTAQPVHQMIFFACSLTPIFFLIAYFLPPLLFYNTGNELLETSYFRILISFAPIVCASVALNGFFTGTGWVKVVTVCTLLANLMNVLLAFLFIFGRGPFPPMGVRGAALSTGIAQTFQTGLLVLFFLSKHNRVHYRTGQIIWDGLKYLKRGLRIGISAGLAHFMELLAHLLFFRIILMADNDSLTLVVLAQTISMLVAFVIEAQSKGISTVTANLIGSRQYQMIAKVLKSAFSLHVMFFLIVFLIFLVSCLTVLEPLLAQMKISWTAGVQALGWMTLFFLFDGLSWILAGLLIAAEDARFLFFASSIIHWGFYLTGAYFWIGIHKNGGETAWLIIACCSFIHFVVFYFRYRLSLGMKIRSITV